VAPTGLWHKEQSVDHLFGGTEPIPSTGLRAVAEPNRTSGENTAQVTCAQLLFAVGFNA